MFCENNMQPNSVTEKARMLFNFWISLKTNLTVKSFDTKKYFILILCCLLKKRKDKS